MFLARPRWSITGDYMEEVFGIKSDINSVIKMTKQFLLVLEQINSKNPKNVIKPKLC